MGWGTIIFSWLRRFLCGLLFLCLCFRVPPSVYRKVKQAPESDRESYLIKELEDVLRKEGLSTNPSEKGNPCWIIKSNIDVEIIFRNI